MIKRFLIIKTIFLGVVFSESLSSVNDNFFIANNSWMLLSTLLVFIMHLGFACLETGLTRSKNTVNILFKNIKLLIFT